MKRFIPFREPTVTDLRPDLRADTMPLDTSITRRTLLQASALATTAGMVLARGGAAAAAPVTPGGTGRPIAKAFAAPDNAYRAGSAGGGRTGWSTPSRSRARSTASPTPASACSRSPTSTTAPARTRRRPVTAGAPRRGAPRSRPHWSGPPARAARRHDDRPLLAGRRPEIRRRPGAAQEVAHGGERRRGHTYDAAVPAPVVHAFRGVTQERCSWSRPIAS